MVREPYSGSVFQKNAAGWTGGVETCRAYYTTPAPKMEEEISVSADWKAHIIKVDRGRHPSGVADT